MDEQLLEEFSEQVHNTWMENKRNAGVTSRKLDTTGEELLRPYSELSESAKDLDRSSVKAVLSAIEAAGYTIVRAAKYKAD